MLSPQKKNIAGDNFSKKVPQHHPPCANGRGGGLPPAGLSPSPPRNPHAGSCSFPSPPGVNALFHHLHSSSNVRQTHHPSAFHPREGRNETAPASPACRAPNLVGPTPAQPPRPLLPAASEDRLVHAQAAHRVRRRELSYIAMRTFS